MPSHLNYVLFFFWPEMCENCHSALLNFTKVDVFVLKNQKSHHKLH